ncbi:MAG: peptidase U32 family protein, partial [Angelakisella sp.]
MTDKRPEVLAPAGDRERLEAAVRYGADAVYLGGKLHNMRAGTPSFELDELAEGVKFAHGAGVRVYFTCNTLPRNDEIPQLESYLAQVAETGVDAFIVSDIGMMMAAKRIAPHTEIHISTQAGITNYLTANELHALGASRVILARELPLEDIRTIREKTSKELDIEVFVHGAICMSFSGRCLISQYMTGRDANRGECAQPCRWAYHLVEEKRPGQYYPVFEDERGSYILNAKDICLIEELDKLIDAGVTSLKIEGRAKSAYYVAV